MYREARKKNKDPVLWKKARFLQNRVELTIKQYKKQKFEEEMVRNKNKPKKFWANIREIWPKRTDNNINMLIDDNGDSIYTDSELSNHINDYFANIGNNLANKIQIKLTQETKQVFPQIVLNSNKDNITNNMITHAELMNIVNDID